MNSKNFGQLDLTKLGLIAKQQPQLVKEVQFKDGIHKLLNVSLLELDEPDKFGNTVTLRVDCKKDNQVQGLSYFVCNMKESQFSQQQPTQQQTPSWDTPAPRIEEHQSDLPF